MSDDWNEVAFTWASYLLGNHIESPKEKRRASNELKNLIDGITYQDTSGNLMNWWESFWLTFSNNIIVFALTIISYVLSFIIYAAGGASFSVQFLGFLLFVYCWTGLLILMGYWGPTVKVIFTLILIVYPIIIAWGWSNINAKLSNSGLSFGSSGSNFSEEEEQEEEEQQQQQQAVNPCLSCLDCTPEKFKQFQKEVDASKGKLKKEICSETE